MILSTADTIVHFLFLFFLDRQLLVDSKASNIYIYICLERQLLVDSLQHFNYVALICVCNVCVCVCVCV
jgi:hypothetical protein